MKIISWNVNGLRAVHKRNFLDWFYKTNADFLCLQEVKAHQNHLPSELTKPKSYNFVMNSANKKGYSGVAIYSKIKPKKIESNLGLKRFDEEGRIIKLDFEDFIIINIYLPHGGRAKENLEYKLKSYERLIHYLRKIKDKKVILIGDFNIAHTELDLARPKNNKNNIMFTPQERGQLDRIINLGFIDTFRKFNQENGNYTWWPYAFNARKRNLGWRLDYAFASKNLIENLKSSRILKDVLGSDHCPIEVKLDML